MCYNKTFYGLRFYYAEGAISTVTMVFHRQVGTGTQKEDRRNSF